VGTSDGTSKTGMTRKQFLTGAAATSVLAAGWPGSRDGAARAAVSRRKRPNILLIMTDQERSGISLPDSLSLPGHDKLKERGVSLRNFVVTTTPCSPSRSVFYTGQHTKLTRILSNPGSPAWEALPHTVPTVGHMLRELGYYTAYKGKWHLSKVKVRASTDLAPYPSTANALEPYGFADYTLTGDPLGDPWSGFRDDRVTASEAVQWLRDANSKGDEARTWFLAVNFVNPHDVMFFKSGRRQDDTRLVKDLLRPLRPAPVGWPYDDDLGYDLPQSYYKTDPATRPWAHRAFARRNSYIFGEMTQGRDEDAWRRLQNYYFNCIRDVDRYVDRIVTAMAENGQMEDTVIIYTSDHGEMAGAQGLTQKGPVAYKENIGVPFIICHPDGKKGEETRGLGTAVDLAPTLLEIAGLSPDQIRDKFPQLHGVSLAPLAFDGKVSTPRDDRGALLYFGVTNWFDPEFLRRKLLQGRDPASSPEGQPSRPSLDNPALFRAIIHGGYKFVRYFKPSEHHTPQNWQMLLRHNELELYDMEQDPDELTNLAQKPETYKQLILGLNDRLNAAIAEEIGADDGSEFPGSPHLYQL